MIPSYKHPAMEELLEKSYGRTTSIKSNRCIPAPIGCGGPADEFFDALSTREYLISGLCQKCQDKIFSSDRDEEGFDDLEEVEGL